MIIDATQSLKLCYVGCYAKLFYVNKKRVSVIQKHVTTLHIKLCDKARNKSSGCGAAGSALPRVVEAASS